MAGSIGRSISIGLSANTKEFSKNLTKAEKDLKRFKSGVKIVGTAVTAGFAAMGVAAVAFGKSAVEAAIADDKAQKQLARTIKNNTKTHKDLSKAVEKSVTALQMQLGVADDELRPAFGKLITATKSVSKSQKLMRIALDVSKGSGKSLDSVVGALSRAYLGNKTSLGKLGIGLDKTKIKTMSFDEITKNLAKTFQGQAKTASETFAGRMEKLNIKWQEFKENVGVKLMPVLEKLMGYIEETVMPYIGGLATGFTGDKGLTKGITNSSISAENFGKKIKGVVDYLRENTGVVKGFAAVIASIWVIGKVSAAVSAINVLIGAYKALRTTAAITAVVESFATAGVNIAPGVIAAGATAAALGVTGLGILGLQKPKTQGTYKPITGSMTSDIGHGYHGGRGGRRAMGGPVIRGRSYLVGENGPELYTPSGSGSITNNRQTMGGGATIINLNGIVDADSARKSIERVLQNSGKRIGAINLTGSTL